MLLKNIFLKTLRDYRRQILIWGGGFGLLMLTYGNSYSSIFGTGPERAKLVEDYRKTVESFTILTGKVYDIGTFGGFVNTKIGSVMPVLLGIWAMLVGSAIIRGEEERGSMDVLLTTPHTRASVLLQKWAALVVAMIAINFLSWLGLTIAIVNTSADLSLGDAALAHLNWALLGLFFGALGLLFGQLTTRKAAAGWAGGLLAGTYLLNNLLQSVDTLDWTKYIYPFYYGSLSQPLARSVGTSWIGITVLVVSLIPLVWAALWMYQQRDINSFFPLFKSNKPIKSNGYHKLPEPKGRWLTNNFWFGLRASLPGVFIWGLSLSVYTVLIMSAFKDIKGGIIDMVSGNGFYKQLGFVNLTSNENILSLFIFLFLVLLVAAYAVVLVSSWTAEENEGRLELMLSTPVPRWRFLLTYFGVALVASALMVGLMGVIFGLSTVIFNIPVDVGNSIAAFVGLWVMCAIIEAIGYILAAFGPTWAVAVTGGLVVLSYLSDLLQDVLKLPDTVTNLSVFKQYGRPLAEGLKWTPQLLLVGLSALLIGIAIARFRQRDIAK